MELFLTSLYKDPFNANDSLTSSSFLNSISHPCANIFSNFADNILPDICFHHFKAHYPALNSTEILQQIAEGYTGVVTPWTYWGAAGTPFPDHQEDGDLNSANFLIAGHPKVWIFKNAAQTLFLQNHFGGEPWIVLPGNTMIYNFQTTCKNATRGTSQSSLTQWDSSNLAKVPFQLQFSNLVTSS